MTVEEQDMHMVSKNYPPDPVITIKIRHLYNGEIQQTPA